MIPRAIAVRTNTTKARLKQRWSQLTDDDLHCSLGKYDELLHRIQARTGEALDVIENAISEACHACGENFSATEATHP